MSVARLDAVTKRVTGVASAVTNAAGNYTVRTRLPIGQAGFHTLTAPTSRRDAGRSRLYGLVVPRPAPRPVAPVVSAPRPPTMTPIQPVAGTYYVNCDAVRAAGRAPLYRGQAGYRAGLDRDNNGVACE